MRFDTNSQLWVDDNGQPLVVQPPKPVGNDNGFSISANQAPVNFNVSNFANSPLPVTTSDGQQYQPQSFNFQTPDLNAGLQLPNDLSAMDKLRVSQTANFNQAITDAGQSFTGANVNLTGGTTAPNNNANNNGANGLFDAFSNMTQGYSLESSLYGLGSALGKKDYTGMTEQEISRSKGNDTLSAIGNAGKLLLGGTRSLLSGAAASHMNNWNINEYKRRRRDALVNNQPGVENAYATIGGAPQYQDGGLVPPPISAELEGNPDTVYDFRPTTGNSVMSLLTGRPSGYDIDPNVSQASVDEALRALPRRASSAVVNNNPPVATNNTPINSNSYDSLNFKTAFNQAYNDKGEGQVFNWRGKVYLLNKSAKVNNNIVSKGKKEPVVKIVEKNTPPVKQESKSTQQKQESKSTQRGLSESEIDRLKALFKRNGVTTSNYIIPAWRNDSQVMNLQNPLIKYQDGGEVINDDLMSQLQQAVDSGDMTPEEAKAYLQQQGGGNPEEQTQETPNVNDIQGQLMQAVQNGEISEEEANAYLQQMQQEPQPQSPQAPQQPQEPQMTPDEAQAQLAQAVESGEISPEEAQTYLQQLYGASVDPNSQPPEPYTGAVREKIKPEEYLTGEVTTGDENKPYNSEVEKDEYINRNGVTQKVVGDKHSGGGEKMNLEKGTIIISDNKRLGATNARALAIQTGLKLKAGDTYSQVVDIFNKKIGLEKLNSEQEELFKKLEKVGDQGNQTTQQLNNEFLNAKINDIEEKKKGLLSQREQLVQVLFELQENDKKAEAPTEVPEYQDGGRVGEYVLDRYGKDAYQYYLDNWKNDPDYNFRDYAQMRERLKGFASDYNVPIPEGFDRFNEAQMDAFAGQLQKNVPNEVATHYGTYVAPTQSGLQWLVDKGVVDKNNDALKKIIKNGKVTVGSYGSLNKDQQQVIANAVDNLDPETLNQYSTANFRDSKWFYRRPKEETIYYRDKDEFDNVINSSPKVGDGVFFSGKSGAYFRPRLLQEKTLGSQKEVDDYIKQYGSNPDKIHKDFLSEGDPMVYNLVRAQDPASVPATEPAPNNLGNLGRKVRRNNFLLPDQSTLPPEALRAVPKYDIRYNYLDNIRLSPEQNLLENYRSYDEARAKMEGLPDTMNQANLAMLTGNVAQANNQTINQINAQNVQNAQQVAQANLGTLNRQAEMDLNLADQYDQRMNRALDVTRKDIEGYYDFNRRVNVGEFNTRHQLALLNDLFNNYGINPDGTIGFDPKTTTPYAVDRFEAIRAQQLQEELKRRKQASSTTQTATKTKVSDNWGK